MSTKDTKVQGTVQNEENLYASFCPVCHARLDLVRSGRQEYFCCHKDKLKWLFAESGHWMAMVGEKPGDKERLLGYTDAVAHWLDFNELSKITGDKDVDCDFEKKRWQLLRLALPNTPLFKSLLRYIEQTPANKLAEEVVNLSQAREGTEIESPFIIFGQGYNRYKAFSLDTITKTADDAERLQKALDDTSNFFGQCPDCHRNNGFLNIGSEHHFYCKEHKKAWCFGEDVFDCWKDETERTQSRNRDFLHDFASVNPWPFCEIEELGLVFDKMMPINDEPLPF